MSDRITGGLAAMTAALLLLPASARAQNPALTTNDTAARQAEAAALERARPLIEADKQRPRVGGMWRVEAYAPALRTVEGKLPPMNAAARTLYNKRIADRRAGRTDDPVEVCLRPGTPRVMWQPRPFLITQAPAKITFFHEYQHIVRHVFLDGPLKTAELEPTWQGQSSGRWEGEALVIETAGFNGQLWLDEAGLPQSEAMKVTERFRVFDGGQSLEDVVTIDDPKFYTAPWTTRVVFRRQPAGVELVEHNCSEKLLEFPLRNYQPGG